jgi:uncharacterized protein YjbI with pentapeptide repeats
LAVVGLSVLFVWLGSIPLAALGHYLSDRLPAVAVVGIGSLALIIWKVPTWQANGLRRSTDFREVSIRSKQLRAAHRPWFAPEPLKVLDGNTLQELDAENKLRGALLLGSTPEPLQMLDSENKVRSTLVQLTSGLLILAGLWFTAQQLTISEASVRLTQESRYADRISAALVQLGNGDPVLRRSAISELQRIARDSPDNHERIYAGLVGHASRKAGWRGDPPATPAEADDQFRVDVEAALQAVGRRDSARDGLQPFTIDLRGKDLRGVALRGANLEGANLREVRLDGATLDGANLSSTPGWTTNLAGARLTGAQGKNARFAGADMSGAYLDNSILPAADLSGVDLRGARLDGARLDGARLAGADLRGVQAQRAQFANADLSGVSLNDADLSDADLSGADLRRSRLDSARLDRANLAGANLCGTFGVTPVTLAAAKTDSSTQQSC